MSKKLSKNFHENSQGKKSQKLSNNFFCHVKSPLRVAIKSQETTIKDKSCIINKQHVHKHINALNSLHMSIFNLMLYKSLCYKKRKRFMCVSLCNCWLLPPIPLQTQLVSFNHWINQLWLAFIIEKLLHSLWACNATFCVCFVSIEFHNFWKILFCWIFMIFEANWRSFEIFDIIYWFFNWKFLFEEFLTEKFELKNFNWYFSIWIFIVSHPLILT